MKQQANALVNEFRVVTALHYYYVGEPAALEKIAGGQTVEDYYCFILNSINQLEFHGYEAVNFRVSGEDLFQCVAYLKDLENRKKDIRVIFELRRENRPQTKVQLSRRIGGQGQRAQNDYQVNKDKTELCFPTVVVNRKRVNAYREAEREIVSAVTR